MPNMILKSTIKHHHFSYYYIMFKSIFILISILILFLAGCKDTVKPENLEKEYFNQDIQWTDTIIISQYEEGNPETVWAYNPEDTLSHYEWKYYQNGTLWIEGPLYQNLRHGKWKAYNEMGNLISQGNYFMGKSQGVKTVWHDNGQKYFEGNQLDDKRIGLWIFYDENGNIIKEINYSKLEDTLQTTN